MYNDTWKAFDTPSEKFFSLFEKVFFANSIFICNFVPTKNNIFNHE